MNMIKEILFKILNNRFHKVFASINLKPKDFEISSDSKCLCLTPHADDESIGMGGVLALYPDNFEVVLLTDGRKGIKDVSVEQAVSTREEEFKCAMQNAGIKKVSSLKIEDKKLLSSFEAFKKIDLQKYDYVFLPNILDQHPDHKAVSLLLKKLLERVKHKPDLKICFYEVWSALGFVNAYVDISDVVEKKKEMINCYKSQTEQKDYVYYALGFNQYRGMLKDKKFVEAFYIADIEDFKKICELY